MFVILAKIVYNIWVFFFKNAFNPQLQSVFSIFFCSKYNSKSFFLKKNDFFKNAAQLRATRRNLRFFRFFFFIIKSIQYIAFFLKKNKNHDTRGKKVKNRQREFTDYIELFLTKTACFCVFLPQNTNIISVFDFFQKNNWYIVLIYEKKSLFCFKTTLNIRLFAIFFSKIPLYSTIF